MKKLISVTVAAAFSFAVSGTALADQTAVTASSSSASTEKMAKELPVRFNFEEVKTEAKIVEIDKTNRTAVLRTPDGKSVMVRVPKELKRFD